MHINIRLNQMFSQEFIICNGSLRLQFNYWSATVVTEGAFQVERAFQVAYIFKLSIHV